MRCLCRVFIVVCIDYLSLFTLTTCHCLHRVHQYYHQTNKSLTTKHTLCHLLATLLETFPLQVIPLHQTLHAGIVGNEL